MAMGDTEIVELFWNRDERAIEATAEKYENYCSSIAYLRDCWLISVRGWETESFPSSARRH